jgi:hypothetical protein
MIVQRISIGVFTVMMLVTLGGCGSTYDAAVSGVVSLDGKTIPRGTVSFQPKAGGAIAFGRIDENGAYVLRTGREDGLPPGDYYVTVSANEPPAVSQSKGGGPPPLGKSITPLWYRSKDTSGLSFLVESGSNEINLELKSQPPAGGLAR